VLQYVVVLRAAKARDHDGALCRRDLYLCKRDLYRCKIETISARETCVGQETKRAAEARGHEGVCCSVFQYVAVLRTAKVGDHSDN